MVDWSPCVVPPASKSDKTMGNEITAVLFVSMALSSVGSSYPIFGVIDVYPALSQTVLDRQSP